MKGWKTKRGGREKVWEGKGREKFRRKVKNGGAKRKRVGWREKVWEEKGRG